MVARNFSTIHEFDTLLTAAQAGADWAWAEIYRDLAGPVTGYLRSRGCKDPEDLCSETFLQVARGINGFEGGSESFRSWVFVIAHRRLIDSRRAIGRRPKTVSDDEHLHLVPDHSNVAEQAIDSMTTERLMEVFDDLTKDQREVLTLRLVGDLSVQQTAEVMGKRPGAIKALQRRALEAVRPSIEKVVVSQ